MNKKHEEVYQQYLDDKQIGMKRGRPKLIKTLSDRVITQKCLDIAVTKLIVKKILPISMAEDEYFREYSLSKFLLFHVTVE